MRPVTINNPKKWNRLINQTQEAGFLNSPAFHNLWQAILKEKVWHRGILDSQGDYLIIYNIVKKNLPFSFNFLFIPQGPLLCQEMTQVIRQKAFEVFFKDIKTLASKERSFFIKIEPMQPDLDIIDFLKQKGFIKSCKEIEPQYTAVINLQKTETDLFGSFHHKARYNIRLAQRYKVVIRLLKDKTEKESAIKLILKTAQTKHFGIFSIEYFKKLILINNYLQTKVFGAFYQDKIIASSIDLIFKKRATYLFGGSDLNYRQVMAPYLLKWEEIKYFKKQGCQEYDLWGICPPQILKTDYNHPLKGVTIFKTKLGGSIVEYPGSFDYIINRPFYYLYLRLASLT